MTFSTIPTLKKLSWPGPLANGLAIAFLGFGGCLFGEVTANAQDPLPTEEASPAAPSDVLEAPQTTDAPDATKTPDATDDEVTDATDTADANDTAQKKTDTKITANSDKAATLRKLGPFLATAQTALKRFDNEISDYTCVLIKRERIYDRMSGPQYLWMKVRERKQEGDELITPLSIYIRYMKPAVMEGREILYVENERDGDMLARRGGRSIPNTTMQVRPTSMLAMSESRYPVTQAGLKHMLEELVRRIDVELRHTDCDLIEYGSAKINGRKCRHYEVRLNERHPESDYKIARILMDEELRLPIYFASYAWPEDPEAEPPLQEEYVFTRLSLNPGLTDKDFQRDNPEYKFAPEDSQPDEDLKRRVTTEAPAAADLPKD